MATEEQNIIDRIKSGTMSLNEIKSTFSSAAANPVTVQDWGICYNSGTGELSEYCSVIALSPGNAITGIGMIAYSSDGTKLYAVQYTNDFSSNTIATSVGTTMYTPSDGNEALCVVYGWTQQSPFYFTQILQIGACQ